MNLMVKIVRLTHERAFKMLIRENAIETAPVVGNVKAFPVRKSVICMVPVSFHGLGTLPVVTNQS